MTVQAKIFQEKLTLSDLESWLWEAADILRGAVKPEKYGDYMLPLLFFKRLSDVYLEEYQQAAKKFKSDQVADLKFLFRFDIPQGCLAYIDSKGDLCFRA